LQDEGEEEKDKQSDVLGCGSTGAKEIKLTENKNRSLLARMKKKGWRNAMKTREGIASRRETTTLSNGL
jgi:hypothetical protein